MTTEDVPGERRGHDPLDRVGSGCSPGAQGSVHCIGCLPLKPSRDLGVNVRCDRQTGVSKRGGDDFERNAMSEHQSRSGVPEGVEPPSSKARFCRDRVIAAREVPRVERRTDRGCEDEVEVLPR